MCNCVYIRIHALYTYAITHTYMHMHMVGNSWRKFLIPRHYLMHYLMHAWFWIGSATRGSCSAAFPQHVRMLRRRRLCSAHPTRAYLTCPTHSSPAPRPSTPYPGPLSIWGRDQKRQPLDEVNSCKRVHPQGMYTPLQVRSVEVLGYGKGRESLTICV